MLSSASFLLYVISIVNFIAISHGALQVLKVIYKGGVDDGLPGSAQYQGDSLPDVGNQFANADRICVFGVWALYSTTDYGLGQESTTTVISVVGKNAEKLECSNTGQIRGLGQVRSIKTFGNRDANQDGISILSDAYLLGAAWEPVQSSAVIDKDKTDLTGTRMGSIAITGKSSWQLCSDTDCKYVVCIDVPKSRYGIVYLNRNTVGDTALNAPKWPLVIKSVQTVDSATCAIYPNPAYPRSQLWRIELNEKSGLDYHEWIPAANYTTALSNDDTDSITTTGIPE